MRIYLTVSPEEVREAAPFQKPLAHAAYRIGEGSSLLSRNLLVQTRGGLLVLSDRAAPPIDRPEALASAILRECARRDYGGVVLDFENPLREDLRRLTSALSRQCAAGRRTLYVPESYAQAAERRIVIVNTAVSGGNFETHIREICAQYGGPQNVALDIQRLRMDFRLPARNGQGRPLSPEALTALTQERHPAVFFSRDLCARYFTYSKNGEGRFVLFDDADTLRQKLCLGQQLGISAAFFQWPEICDIAADLFRRG